MERRLNNGITLIELMVALAIAAVMLMFALPAFNDFTAQRQMASGANLVIGGINYARSEAAMQGQNVSLQAIDSSDGDDEWGPGFCVTLGDPGDCATPLNLFEATGAVTINATSAGLDGEDNITFNANGMFIGGAANQIAVCGANADSDPGREIRISAIGRASVQTLVCFP
ncbi:MAG: type IV fimbrial biogenesis protein FimT [Candidatus Azotimanducaceae bacterium]